MSWIPDGPILSFINVAIARRLFESHCRGMGRHGQLIWSLLVLARWLDTWSQVTIAFQRCKELRCEIASESLK